MKLTYRGASYEYNPASLEVSEVDALRQYQNSYQRCHTLAESNYPLVYRGASYTTAQVAQALASVPISGTPQRLTYRGVQYNKNGNGIVEFARPAKASLAPKTITPAFVEATAVHHENLRRNVQHRLEIAKIQGNQNLVSQLEAESKQLAL
ncbi:DUF4278 domain-containing protein [Leptolyngbyaceae cyanobacterium UHCC 1019]